MLRVTVLNDSPTRCIPDFPHCLLSPQVLFFKIFNWQVYASSWLFPFTNSTEKTKSRSVWIGSIYMLLLKYTWQFMCSVYSPFLLRIVAKESEVTLPCSMSVKTDSIKNLKLNWSSTSIWVIWSTNTATLSHWVAPQSRSVITWRTRHELN